MAGAATLYPFGMTTANYNLSEIENGSQRLPLEKLKEWESLKYGMFIPLLPRDCIAWLIHHTKGFVR